MPTVLMLNEITLCGVLYQVLPDVVGAACDFLLLSECASLFLSCCAVLANVSCCQ